MRRLRSRFGAGKFLLAALLAITATMPADASVLTWELTYSGGGIAADIFLTTTDTVNGFGAYEITGISGTRNGATIGALLPAGDNDTGHGTSLFSDNELFPVDPHLEPGGITFQIMSELYNLYFNAGDTDRYYDIAGIDCCSVLGTEVNVQLTQLGVAAPEPGSLALFGLCAVALGFSRRKRAG